MTTLTQAEVHRLFDYDRDTGLFTRRLSTASTARAGDVAGTLTVHGYIVIEIEGKKVRAHRLAWFYVHGLWPTHEIDHVNQVRTDNRLLNLRDVPHVINAQNRKRATGITHSRGRWVAQINVANRHLFLGSFDSEASARKRYEEAKRHYHPESTHV